MNFKNTLTAMILVAGAPDTALAEKNDTDLRTCLQPFAGQLVRVSCENIASLLRSVENQPVRPLATIDGKGGSQFNQINDAAGHPVLYIYTPPGKKPKKTT